MVYIDNAEIIEDIKRLLEIPYLNGILFHLLEELKLKYNNKIEEHKDLVTTIDPIEITPGEKENPEKKVNFILSKKESGWKISPVNKIPPKVIEHIINLDVLPGEVYMESFKLEDNRKIDLTLERHSFNYYTGSIKAGTHPIEKNQARNKRINPGSEKTVELKILLNYLLNHEVFYEYVNRIFKSKWKPYLDKQVIKNIEGIISD